MASATARAPVVAAGLQRAAVLPRRATPFSSTPARSAPIKQRSVVVQAAAAAEAPSSRPQPSYAGAADTYAVVEIGGHQLIVEEGRWYNVNRLEAAPGSKLALGRVLALKENGEFKVGQPYLEGVHVEAEVLEELKGDKVLVYKMKPKKHYRRKNGHRQPLSKLLITKVGSA